MHCQWRHGGKWSRQQLSAVTDSILYASRGLPVYTLTCFQEIFGELSAHSLCRLLPGQRENTELSYLSSSVGRSNYQSSTGQKDCILLVFKCHHPLRYHNKIPRSLLSKASTRWAEVSLQTHSTHLKTPTCTSKYHTAVMNSSPAATTSIFLTSIRELAEFKA